jgi:hypothetical protein
MIKNYPQPSKSTDGLYCHYGNNLKLRGPFINYVTQPSHFLQNTPPCDVTLFRYFCSNPHLDSNLTTVLPTLFYVANELTDERTWAVTSRSLYKWGGVKFEENPTACGAVASTQLRLYESNFNCHPCHKIFYNEVLM